MKNVLAKSSDLKVNQKEQTLVEHIKDLMTILVSICSSSLYSEEDKIIMVICCICHDLGKINDVMQRKLQLYSEISSISDEEEIKRIKKLKTVRHNILSGAFLKMILDKLSLSEVSKDLIYKSVMLHHGGYEDYIGVKITEVQEDIYNHIEKGIFEDGEYDLSDIEEYIGDTLKIDFKFNKDELDYDYVFNMNEGIKDEDNKVKYILYKGLLNLIDHSASSQEKNIKFYSDFKDSEIDGLIKENILQKMKALGDDNIKLEDINFTELQEDLRRLSKKNVLTVAFTGAGKTVADYRKGFDRKFFLVPNKISAESFYRDSIFKDEDYVGLLHGDINLYLEGESKEENEFKLTLRDINLSGNFCKPYVIATVDQLLLSMFKFPGYEKVFAAIKGSSITVDEVHLLEPRMFLILLYFIQFTTKYLDVDFHLMTATLPKAYKDQMELKGITFNDENGKISFVESNKNAVIADGKDVKCEFISDNKVVSIVKNGLKDDKKILIIKNLIDDANSTYDELKSKFPDKEINLLHSRFKFEDKKDKYDKILKQSGDIWISTQAVEIALDLDFNIIISDLAPMDCLIQRMGRCNRHNRYEYGEFYILPLKEDVYNKKLKEVTRKILDANLKKSKVSTMKTRKEILDGYYESKEVNSYFNDEFLSSERDIKSIYGLNIDNFTGPDLMFKFEPYKNIADNKKEASKLFRDIDINYKVILEKDFGGDAKEIQKKSIQVSKGVFNKLKKSNLIMRKEGYFLITPGKWNYSKDEGLTLQ